MEKNVKNYVEIGDVGRIIIPEKLKRKIDVLHREIGNTEWSGILIYKTLVKSIKSLKDLVFRAEDIFLMDVGSAAYTSYKYDGSIVDMYTQIPQAMNMNIGLVHDHHSLGAFFSGTDLDEIVDNAKHYNYYVSLVTDFKGTYKCKIAIPTEVETTSEYKLRDRDGKARTVSVSEIKKSVIVGDLSVTIEYKESVDQWFMNRIVEIKKQCALKPATKSSVPATSPKNNGKKSDDVPYSDVWDTSIDLFIINVLSFGSYTMDEIKKEKLSVYSVLKELEKLNNEEFELCLDSLEKNISIVHYNVYGPNEVHNEVKHVKSMVDTLKRYTYVCKERIDEIINLLEIFIEYEKQFTTGY